MCFENFIYVLQQNTLSSTWSTNITPSPPPTKGWQLRFRTLYDLLWHIPFESMIQCSSENMHIFAQWWKILAEVERTNINQLLLTKICISFYTQSKYYFALLTVFHYCGIDMTLILYTKILDFIPTQSWWRLSLDSVLLRYSILLYCTNFPMNGIHCCIQYIVAGLVEQEIILDYYCKTFCISMMLFY